jgi:biofilm PGA synthesis N-glycosyltransferase PgaC
MTTLPTYALITPARNEADFIELTLKSVVAQTVRPLKWVIVSDGSTDCTDEIVQKYAADHPWIELIRMPDRWERNFAGKVCAFNAGYANLANLRYDVIGNLDADVSFDPEYFAFLLEKFAENSRLGVAGTPYREGSFQYDYRFTSIEHVSGQCQLFRRECFEEIGGYVPRKIGGIDLVAVTTARMKGWQTRTFPEKPYDHHRKMGTAAQNALIVPYKVGRADYVLGSHPVWEFCRCVYQLTRPPILLGGSLRLIGFFWAMAERVQKQVSVDFVKFRRTEQMRRLRTFYQRYIPCINTYSEERPRPITSPLPTSDKATPVVETVETSVKGKWTAVPALAIDGKAVIVKGRWIRVAVVHDERWLDSEVKDPELYVKKLNEHRSNTLRADIFTFAQKVPGSQPRYDHIIEWDSVAAVRVSSYKEWWEKLPQETRKNVRRSQKRGVLVKVKRLDDELVRGIVGVNNDSTLRQKRRFDHYGKSFDQVKKDQSSFLDRSDFVCAYFGDELIGFLKLVYRGEVASILQVLPKESHQDKRPANALIARAVELCEAKGIMYLTYGLFNYGNKRESSLREFKVRNGFEEMVVPRYLIPLTTKGKLCMKLNLHRGILGILPHSIIKVSIGARAQWYRFKRFMGRCSSMLEQPNRIRQMGRSNPPAGSNPDPT